jgi:hypothetical protein
MKRLLYSTALISVLAGSANADTICGINTDTILKWPGYAGKQNVWFDKGEYLFKFSSIYKGKILTSEHFKVFKESCQKSSILVINNTENKKSKSVVSSINPPIIIPEPIIDISGPIIDISFEDMNMFSFLRDELFEDDDEFIGTINT